jgi:hypothetical protein
MSRACSFDLTCFDYFADGCIYIGQQQEADYAIAFHDKKVVMARGGKKMESIVHAIGNFYGFDLSRKACYTFHLDVYSLAAEVTEGFLPQSVIVLHRFEDLGQAETDIRTEGFYFVILGFEATDDINRRDLTDDVAVLVLHQYNAFFTFSIEACLLDGLQSHEGLVKISPIGDPWELVQGAHEFTDF